MKNFFIPFFLLCLHLSSGICSESIGFYSEGKLSNAQSVFDRGTPIQKLFIQRQRLYTSDEMHNLLSLASDFLKSEYSDSEPLQVGDLSNQFGGVATGHASHQNGLDGDIVYLRKNHYVQSSTALDWDEDFIGKNAPTANFDAERNFELFKHLVKNSTVTRIFVDVSIKRLFCQKAHTQGTLKDPLVSETLRRLRPENLHRTHFHVRISCPVDDHECTPQSAPEKGDGCDEISLMLEMAENHESC